jgi:hypothetical protein
MPSRVSVAVIRNFSFFLLFFGVNFASFLLVFAVVVFLFHVLPFFLFCSSSLFFSTLRRQSDLEQWRGQVRRNVAFSFDPR